VKEIIYTEPDHTSHSKASTDKSVIQDDEDYKVLNNKTMLQRGSTIKYAAVLDTVGTKSK
jgi:hypothetical protein